MSSRKIMRLHSGQLLLGRKALNLLAKSWKTLYPAIPKAIRVPATASFNGNSCRSHCAGQRRGLLNNSIGVILREGKTPAIRFAVRGNLDGFVQRETPGCGTDYARSEKPADVMETDGAKPDCLPYSGADISHLHWQIGGFKLRPIAMPRIECFVEFTTADRVNHMPQSYDGLTGSTKGVIFRLRQHR